MADLLLHQSEPESKPNPKTPLLNPSSAVNGARYLIKTLRRFDLQSWLMTPTETNGDKLFTKLIFAVVSALFFVMTAIGGFTASHLISQVDEIQKNTSSLTTSMEVEKESQKQRDIRLSNIETFIYSNQNNSNYRSGQVRGIQKPQE